jgi:NTE family protein
MRKILLLIILFFCFNVYSQINEDPDVKVGLVLSGGGAKGLAHIGVLKTIDSLGIRIDHIAGTSMGAIIGALYASGYSGKQLDSIFNEMDFENVISDYLPRASKTFYERENSERHAITLPFNDFKVTLPPAISRGQNVFNLLSRLTLHLSAIEDFEELPIPFFCMATDIETGQPVLLERGNLAQAIAASGAFPSLFQPVIIDDQVLIDGGVTNNYPLDELRAKGMDIIVGVDVQDGLANRDNLKTAPDILLQINNYRTINDMKIKSAKTDVYIKPDIQDYSVISFDFGKQIIKNGERAAFKKIFYLKDIADKQKSKARKPSNIILNDSITINTINIVGNEKFSRSYILGKLKFKGNGTISYQDFNEGINNLASTNNFDMFSYRFIPRGDGYDLNAVLTENQINTYLKFGVHYDDLYKSAALINITQKHVLFDSDVTSIDVILGDNVRYNFEYYIDNGFYWSMGLRSRYNAFSKNINAETLLEPSQITSTGLNKIGVELTDFTNQLYVQTLFRKDFSLSLGAEHKRLNIISETIINNSNNQETVFEKSDFFGVFGTLKFDSYNNKYFPSKGFYFNGDFHWYLSSSDYNNDFKQYSYAKADLGYAFKLSKSFSINLESQGGFKIGDNQNPSLDYVLGGYGNNFINNFVPFLGYDYLSIPGDSFVKGTIKLDYEIFKKNHINLIANYANVADNIFDSGEWITSPNYSGYGLGYSIETFIGPLEAKYTWSPETGESKWFFNLGFWF